MEKFSNWTVKTDSFFKKRKVLAFDLDDTLTTHGRLPSQIIELLERVQKRKIKTVIVTGRPAGWADSLIKLLPMDGIVCENGSVLFFWKNGQLKKEDREEPVRLYWDTQKDKYSDVYARENAEKLNQISAEILAAVKRSRVASDQFSRLYDLAIDFAEEVDPPLGFEEAQKIEKIFLKHGADAKVSSIHVNGWFGRSSKKTGLKHLVEKEWNLNFEQNITYVGDSPNDGSLFEAVHCSVGVANIKEFIGKVDFVTPRYVTKGRSSAGAKEVLLSFLKRK